VHYGKGEDGKGAGGSWELFFVAGDEVPFPQMGNGVIKPDMFGHGEILSAKGFLIGIADFPDSGPTAALFGIAVVGLGFAQQKLKL
jgi:hypothetical protein